MENTSIEPWFDRAVCAFRLKVPYGRSSLDKGRNNIIWNIEYLCIPCGDRTDHALQIMLTCERRDWDPDRIHYIRPMLQCYLLRPKMPSLAGTVSSESQKVEEERLVGQDRSCRLLDCRKDSRTSLKFLSLPVCHGYGTRLLSLAGFLFVDKAHIA